MACRRSCLHHDNCFNCGTKTDGGRKRCHRCNSWYSRHKPFEWPMKLEAPPRSIYSAKSLCKDCGERKPIALHRCNPCYMRFHFGRTKRGMSFYKPPLQALWKTWYA